jgi:hypothetical protein
MKPLSISRVAIATAWLILFSAFTNGKQASSSTSHHSRDNTYYYYYLADDDSYDAYNTVAGEIAHLESLYGVYVDTNPFGGTLLARGYINNWYPHTIWPSSYLYGHY